MTVSQTLFRQALLDPAQAVPDGLSDGIGRAAEARFNVYRNNVAVSLTEALHIGFPIITRLLGTENMDGLAGMFLRAHPPVSPLLMHYGAAFPDFLAKLDQLSHLGYLADVARLELAMRASYHAADSDPIDPSVLGALPPEALMQSVVTLSPALHVIQSDWPLYDIWRFNTQENAPKPAHDAQDVLITRAEFDPVPHHLPPGGATWITALADGQTIGSAHEKAVSDHPGFDLGATLALLLTGNALIFLSTKD